MFLEADKSLQVNLEGFPTFNKLTFYNLFLIYYE